MVWIETSFTKTVKDFRTKLEYHEYLKNQLHRLLSAKCSDFKFIKEYPTAGVHGIDIVGVKEILGKEREIIAIEVLGIAEERTQRGAPLSSGQVQKIMTDISKLLLRSKPLLRFWCFQRLK